MKLFDYLDLHYKKLPPIPIIYNGVVGRAWRYKNGSIIYSFEMDDKLGMCHTLSFSGDASKDIEELLKEFPKPDDEFVSFLGTHYLLWKKENL